MTHGRLHDRVDSWQTTQKGGLMADHTTGWTHGMTHGRPHDKVDSWYESAGKGAGESELGADSLNGTEQSPLASEPSHLHACVAAKAGQWGTSHWFARGGLSELRDQAGCTNCVTCYV